jgi:hypothetical protein
MRTVIIPDFEVPVHSQLDLTAVAHGKPSRDV